MRTEDVLDSIDHALEDWSVSGDAMRWTPEPAPVRDMARSAVSFHINVDTQMMSEALNRAFRSLGEWAQSVNQAMIGIEQFASQLSREDPFRSVAKDGDPRARALALRQARNTGPSRDLVHQRRPRKHMH